MPQPIYAAFSGNALKILPLSPYGGIIPEGTVINGFPDGIRGSVGVKLVKIEEGVFEHKTEDINGTIDTSYYPVKVITEDLGDGRIREHLTNDEECLWLNDLLDGPEKYLRGEYEKTRRNEPARFVFMRKFEYPDGMYEIHNPETKKCNVFDMSSGKLTFPYWCDAVEFKDGKWSGSNNPQLEGIDALAQAFVEGITEKDLALDRYLKGMQADVPPQPEGVSGSAQAYYYMLGRKPKETADLLSAVAKAASGDAAPGIEKALGPGTRDVAEKLARDMEHDYNGLKPDMLERAASLYREGKMADGFREARGAMEDFAFNHMCYAVSKVWNTGDDKGSLSVDSNIGRRVVRNTWLVHGTTPESAVNIAKRGFDRGNKIGMLAYNLSDGADGQKHDYSGDYLFAFDAGSDIHGSGETSVDLDKYGDALVVFRGSGYKAFHHGDNEYQVIFDYHEPNACFLVISSSAASELGFPVRKAGENAMAIYNDQVFGQKDGKPVPLFAAQHSNDCVEWIVAHGDQYRNFMFRWGTGENKGMTEGLDAVAAAFTEAVSFAKDTDLYSDRKYGEGLDPHDTSDATLMEAFRRAAGDTALDNDRGKALYRYIKQFLMYSTKGKTKVYRGVAIPAKHWDELIRDASGKVNQIDEDTIRSLLSNTRKDFNSYSTSPTVAEHYATAGIDNAGNEPMVAVVISAEASPEDINFPMSMANNAKDLYNGSELVITDARELDNFRIEKTNIGMVPRHDSNGKGNLFPMGNGKFMNIVFDPEDGDVGNYYVEIMHSCPGVSSRRMTVPAGKSDRVMGPFSEVKPVGEGLFAATRRDKDGTTLFKAANGKLQTILDDGRRFVFMRKHEYPNGLYEIHDPNKGECNIIVTAGPDAGRLLFDTWHHQIEYDDDNDKWFGIAKDGKETELMTDYTASNAAKTEQFSWNTQLEGIDALAVAFVENVQTRFTREEDLEKYADGDVLMEKKPEKKTGLVLVPADLVAIVARRMQASAEYDGLNYVIDPEGLTLHLDNGYMTGQLSYDTHREALVSPTAGGEYPLDDNTDLDWITKKILADMDPERFEEKIAGKYDEGRDLVATLASSLRSKAERMGRKFRFQEVGYKLSVENKETGDNYSSTVLEYDPEAKVLKGKDGGSSFSLDDGTNIRKLASEIFNRTETMDL